jgi:hypothetical protein
MTIPFDLERFKQGDIALTRDGREAKFLYYDESIVEKGYRLGATAEGQLLLLHESGLGSGREFEYNHDLVAMKPKAHKHQALMDSYQMGQAWQYDSKDSWSNCNLVGSRYWYKPLWDESREYRLHPHNELIQAFNRGAEIEQQDSTGKWCKVMYPSWYEEVVFRVKPKTKTVYEWIATCGAGVWHVDDELLTEEAAALKYGTTCEYKKTGRKFEVEG